MGFPIWRVGLLIGGCSYSARCLGLYVYLCVGCLCLYRLYGWWFSGFVVFPQVAVFALLMLRWFATWRWLWFLALLFVVSVLGLLLSCSIVHCLLLWGVVVWLFDWFRCTCA